MPRLIKLNMRSIDAMIRIILPNTNRRALPRAFGIVVSMCCASAIGAVWALAGLDRPVVVWASATVLLLSWIFCAEGEERSLDANIYTLF